MTEKISKVQLMERLQRAEHERALASHPLFSSAHWKHNAGPDWPEQPDDESYLAYENCQHPDCVLARSAGQQPERGPCIPACDLATSTHATTDGVERCDLCGYPAVPPTGERPSMGTVETSADYWFKEVEAGRLIIAKLEAEIAGYKQRLALIHWWSESATKADAVSRAGEYTATEMACRGCMGPCGRCDAQPPSTNAVDPSAQLSGTQTPRDRKSS